jgi:hypothetical protein
MIKRRGLVPHVSVSIQTTLSAEVHLERQFLLEEQRLNKERSMINRVGTLKQFQIAKDGIRTKCNLNKGEWGKMVHLLRQFARF